MGIQDRDYMKRRPDDDGERSFSPDSEAEEMLSGFLRKHPRFFLYAGIGLAALILIAILASRFSGSSH